jgi:lysine biosynthesis protein LysW
MAVGYCIDCENSINLGKEPFIGQRVSCHFCGAYLEVMELAPIEFEWAYDEDEDWDLDDDEGDEEIEEEEPEYWQES